MDYSKWIEAAENSGDTETMMIAMRANGDNVCPLSTYNIPLKRQKQIRRMTVRGAQRIANKWEESQ